MTKARSLPLIALAVGLVVLVLNLRLVAGGQTWADVRYHAEVGPPRLAAGEALRAGTLPAWWDGTGFGVPLLAHPGHAALYPLTWLAPGPRGLDLVLLLHLAWAALGVCVWARGRRGGGRGAGTPVSDPSALVAGLLVVTTGLLASAAVRGALPGLAHLPWLGAAAQALPLATSARTRRRLAAAIAGLLGLVALAGELALLVDAVVLALVLGTRRSTLALIGAAVLAGLALGAVQWLPAILELPRGAGATLAPLPLSRLVELLVPGSFGGADPDHGVAALAGTQAWAPSLYVGAPLIALALVRPLPARAAAVMLTFAALALGIGRGGGWPAYLGAPELHVGALVLVLAAHAGAGLDALLRGERRALLAGAGAALGTGVALIALATLRGRHPEAAAPITRALVDGGVGLACVVGALALAWRGPAGALPLVLALLVLPGAGATPSTAPRAARALVTDPPLWATAAEDAPRPARLFRPAFLHGITAGLEDTFGTLGGTSAWRWGIAAARSEHPGRAREFDAVWLAASREGGALLDRFGIELAILPATLVEPRKLTELARRGEWALVSLPVTAVAAVYRGARFAVDPTDALALLFAPAGGTNILGGTTVLRGRGEPLVHSGKPLPCALVRWEAGDIEVRCTTDAPGHAVVTSAAVPGWVATVDGVTTPWLASDVLRRAVPVTPGTHTITWRYTPPGLRVGALVGALGLLGVLALLGAARRSRVAAPPDRN